MCQQRKGILRDKIYVKQAYEGTLDHIRHILTIKQVLKPKLTDRPVETEVPAVDDELDAKSSSIFQSQEMLQHLNLSDPLGLNSPGSRSSPNKKKFTKQDFFNNTGDLQTKNEETDDPLSQLDPLWSMKHNDK